MTQSECDARMRAIDARAAMTTAAGPDPDPVPLSRCERAGLSAIIALSLGCWAVVIWAVASWL